jgi:hypothetical protein
MSELMKTASQNLALASLQGLKKNLQNVVTSMPAKLGGDPILRLGKDGIWVYGADSVEVQEGSLWAINPFSLVHGYVCWTRWEDYKLKKKNELVGETMVSMNTPLPDPSQLRKYEVEGHPGEFWGYAFAIGFNLACTNGDDKGVQVVYKPTSVGGVNACREIIDKIMAQLDADISKPVPLVDLGSGTYKHKSYGTVVTPEIKIKGWAALDANEEGEIEQEEVAEAPAKAAAPASQRRAPATVPYVPAAEESPFVEDAPDATVAAPQPAEGRVRRRRA